MSATVIIGKHAVRSFIESDKFIEKLFVRQKNRDTPDIQQIIRLASQKNIPIQRMDPRRFDQRFDGEHQGIACITHELNACTLSQVLNEKPNVILMLDHIEDPHNFGAICRSAKAFGITTVCYPKNRNAQISPTVVKASAGAIESLALCKVTNLNQTLKKLKQDGYWVYAASSNKGHAVTNLKVHFPMVLICGSEAKGISPSCASETDEFVHIPLNGKTSSLNVSVATGIIIHKLFSTNL